MKLLSIEIKSLFTDTKTAETIKAHVVIWNVEPFATLSEAGIVIIDGKVKYAKKEGELETDYIGL